MRRSPWLDKSLHYLQERRELLNYAKFRAQGYPIGSGSAWEWGECPQTGGTESHERSRHALGPQPREREVGYAQSGL